MPSKSVNAGIGSTSATSPRSATARLLAAGLPRWPQGAQVPAQRGERVPEQLTPALAWRRAQDEKWRLTLEGGPIVAARLTVQHGTA